MGKKKDPRKLLLSFVSNDTKKVLDLGCGRGGLSEKLKKRIVTEVVGVEANPDCYYSAKNKLDKVYLGDIEKVKLPYPAEYFDCIICADVLEHLRDPKKILEKYKFYLKKEGCLIASIPNVRYYKIIIRLLFGGTWDYSDQGGLLDATHLRFFTLVNMRELFQDAGFNIVDIKRNIVAARGFKIWNLFFLNRLKNLLTYQYFFKVKKSNNEVVKSKRKRFRF